MPPRPRSEVSYVKTTLPCPIYAADFDPYNRGYLVVGGGGGESRSGVPNQISVLDVSDRSTITTVVEIQLTRDEDNVQSLGCLSTKDGLLIFAGINSSEADQNAGDNEHFRSFNVRCPPRKKLKTEDDSPNEKGDWRLIGKRALFKTSTAVRKETYQRLLRLSPSQRRESGSSRIGAIASGSGSPSEIIVFDATRPIPEAADLLTRIELAQGTEARDLDIFETDEAEFSLAYCSDYNLYEQTYEYDFKKKQTAKTPNGPRRVYDIPVPEPNPADPTPKPVTRPKIRCVRFLNARNVVAVLNKPDRSGAELRIYHLYPTGPAILAQQMALPRRIKQVVSMDVCSLDADEEGNQQIMVAVAAQDISIEVYTTNFQRKTETFSRFRSYLALKDVHEHQMTKICFSPFHAISRPAGSEKKTSDDMKPSEEIVPTIGRRFVRLASTSMGNTVVVDAFPLTPLDANKKNSRHVLSHPNDEKLSRWTHIVVISMVALAVAYFLQSFLLGEDAASINLLTGKFHGFEQNSATMDNFAIPLSTRSPDTLRSGSKTKRLHSFLSAHSVPHPTNVDPGTPQQTAVVLRPDADSTGIVLDVVSPDEALLKKDEGVKPWHELDEVQKTTWKAKLKHAGHWTEEEGEAVFQGILFSEFAGLMGQAAAEVLREL